jgi:hypothetical protein
VASFWVRDGHTTTTRAKAVGWVVLAVINPYVWSVEAQLFVKFGCDPCNVLSIHCVASIRAATQVRAHG